ncbi:arginase [Zychaea mexicana]|uniref:arginase n=1 Tax=Zychaea mexicana TaxID=64656 RepID=UPI0022FE647C|nr:arginase [Zychaea mexicana]KAI9490940.1 arginase [Zychaea mexicana]
MTAQTPLIKSKQVSIIGVPFNGGQPQAGVEKGPLRLVESGLAEQLEELGWAVEHESNEQTISELRPASDPDVMNLKQPKYVSAVTQNVAQQIHERAKQGKFVLTLGGDHSVALATVSGVFGSYPDACLVWVDAHADLNTPEATESGNVHGCPLSFLMGLSTDHPDFQWVKPVLKANRLVYIGLRDLDGFEKKTIKELGIPAFTMHHVDKWGIGTVVETALNHVNPKRDLPIHLSFDVDALDPSVAPSTGTPVRGGLTFREGHYICEALAETGLLVAADIMEVNPTLEDELAAAQTIQVGCSLARCCLGETLL